MIHHTRYSHWPATRSRFAARRAFPWLTVIALLASSTGLVLILPGNPLTAKPSSGSDSEAVGAVAQAQASLEQGAGPARGVPVDCQSVDEGAGAQCGSSAAVPTHVGESEPAAGSTPGPRYGATMAYDAADGYVLLFSGSSQNDTWTFADGVWTELNLSVQPHPRVGASMTFDARDGYVLYFGGIQSSSSGYNSTDYFLDTWSFAHGVWTNLIPASTAASNSPSGRYDASMTYDALDGYVVLFGGNYKRNFLNDTWKFVGGQWTNITATVGSAPPCRFGAGMTFDPADGYVLLFGGDGKRGVGCGASLSNLTLADSWSFRDGTWAKLTPGQAPPASWSVALAYDAADGYVVLFGGIGATDMALQQTWKYSSGDWSLISPTTYPPTSPPARFSANMVYDGHDSYLVLAFGLSEPQKDAPLLKDVWTFRGSVWASLTGTPPPPFRSSMAMTYDAKDGFVLLFGGLGPSGPLGDTWKFVDGVWFQLTPVQSPPPRYNASMAYDANPSDQFVVLFGGVGQSGQLLNDTWSFVRGEWSAIPGEIAPSPRSNGAMAYDANSKVDRVILFGGLGANLEALDDTWLFQNGSWTNVTPSAPNATNSPSARYAAAMAYDDATGDDYVVLFGGFSGSQVLGDTWLFTNREQWTAINPNSAAWPAARYAAGLVYDVATGSLVLFGGTTGTSLLSDTWTFSHEKWSELSPSFSPPGRAGAGLAYDYSGSLVLLFSGNRSNASSWDDVWALSSDVWTNITVVMIHLPALASSRSALLSTLDYGLIATAGIVAVALIAVVLVRRRKRPRETAETAPSGPPPTAP